MSFKDYKTRVLKEKPVINANDAKIIGAQQNAIKKGLGLVDVDRGYKTTEKGTFGSGNYSVTQSFASRDDLIKQNDAKLPTIAGMKLRTQGNSGIDVGDFANQAARKAGKIGGDLVDNNPKVAAALKKKGDEFGIKNLDGQTFRNIANQQGDKLNFDINKNVPGTREYKAQGVADTINLNTSKFKPKNNSGFKLGVNSYEPEGEFLSYEEVEVFVESLSEQGYTEEQILLELDRKGFGSVVLGKGLELGMSAIKNTYKAGKAFRGVVNRGIKDTKLTKDILSTAKTLRQQPTTTSSSGGTLKNFMSRVKGKLSRTDIKTNTPTKSVNPQVLGGAAAKKTPVVTNMKNVTPIGNRITAATNKIKAGGTTAAVTGGAVAGSKLTSSSPTKVTPAAVTNVTKKEVTPTKNPVVKKSTPVAKKTSERGRSVDRAYGAQIAQTRKLRGDAAAEKQRNKFINRAITSKEMDEGVSDQFKPSLKDELLSSANKRHKKAKSFKQFKKDAQRSTLKKGEVRKLVNGKWVSNKEEVEHIDEKKKGLWDNIHAKRKRGEPPAKKGDKDYPKTLNVEAKTAAWQRKEGKNKKGGLNEKGRKSYERENPGSDLKAPQPEGGPRKRSFCARMGGVKGPMKKPDGSPTRKALALRKWKC